MWTGTVCEHGEKPTWGSFASRLKRILIYFSFISFIKRKIIPWNGAAFRCFSGPRAWAMSFPSWCLWCQYPTEDGALLSDRAGPSSLHIPWLPGGTSSTWHQRPSTTSQGSSVPAPHVGFYGPDPKFLQAMPTVYFRSGSAASLCRDLREHLPLNTCTVTQRSNIKLGTFTRLLRSQ